MEEEKIIEEIPGNPVQKAGLAAEKCEDETFKETVELYLMLRRLMRAPYTKREEYRRHVTMIVDFEGESKEVDIDLLKEYYDRGAVFLSSLKKRVEPYRDREE
jgi:hypothetical protein